MNLINSCDNQLLIDIFLHKEKFTAVRKERTFYNNLYYSGFDAIKVL